VLADLKSKNSPIKKEVQREKKRDFLEKERENTGAKQRTGSVKGRIGRVR
jgi:hypothetical protein